MNTRPFRFALIASVATIWACAKTPTDPTPDGTQVTLHNSATVAIASAGASTCDDLSAWPNNLSAPLQPGQDKTVDIYAGCWDLEAKFQDGTEKIVWDLKLTKGQKYTWNITK
jgi:hypothetical protein